MDESNSCEAKEPWGSRLYGNPCRECHFDWEMRPTATVRLVEGLPAEYAGRLRNATGREFHPDLAWSTSAYVSHVSDNLRIWSERLKGALVSGEKRVAGYDQDLLGVARRYEEINLHAALWSLDWAVLGWTRTMREALKAGTELEHSTRGIQRAEDIARSNAHDAVHHLWDIDRILALHG